MLYYRPTPAWESTLQIMAEIDTLNLEATCNATRQMMDDLAREGIPMSRDRLRHFMRHMRLGAIDQKPRTKSLEIHPGVSPAWLG